MSAGRRVLALLLLAVGFAAGSTWTTLQAADRARRDAGQPRPVEARGPLTADELSVTTLFEQASPSVVNVTSIAIRTDFFRLNEFEIPQGSGTGFVWDNAGHIVTNYHVIMRADQARVTLNDQSSWEAEVVGFAPEKDLAVLHIDAPTERLPPIRLGTSHDLRVGQTVLAIGNPFGFDQTLTTGIISALGREIESVARVPIRDVIQTDAAINPGNSGGPLLDSSGRLIGVNTAIASPSGSSAGIGFAIPVDTVNSVVPDLITYGRIRRPTLGVELAPRQVSLRLGLEGVLIWNVIEDSGAARAGLQPTTRDRRGRWVLGDILLAVGDQPVRSAEELGLRLEEFKPGDRVKVTVDRNGRRLEFEVELGDPS